MSKEVITLPKRGLKVNPPAETRTNMEAARCGEIVLWSREERARLQMLIGCPILAKRYPTPDSGQSFMEEVDYAWQEELLGMANEVTADIVKNWKAIAPDKEIAVLLFGSVAKGLVKSPKSTDPSNIDLSVIGEIDDAEKERLFDAIRPKRKEIQCRIVSESEGIDHSDPNIGNVGVMIQTPTKLRNDNCQPARNYIASGARALYDPEGIWSSLETDAIEAYLRIKNKNKKNRTRQSSA